MVGSGKSNYSGDLAIKQVTQTPIIPTVPQELSTANVPPGADSTRVQVQSIRGMEHVPMTIISKE